ncbi:hypothetical protein F4804DRAFT_307215 [Jackrogersella minutella]|nr:hypothetical protein F4804DRAFT_307215 [Jackrogersella minutella]
MAGERSYYSDEGPELVALRIRTYFDLAPHFTWGGQLGAGANGVIYKISHKANGRRRKLAVKIAPIDVDLGGNKSFDENSDIIPDEILSLDKEKVWLRRLRNNPHIIQSLDLPNDPLAQTLPAVWPHRMRNWIFLEYAENGALKTLSERHVEQYDNELLPNRLLWRFFMCLVRGCIEMAYYDAKLNGQPVDLKTASFETLDLIEPGPLAHQDLGTHNILVGATALDESLEHNATPILKIIDFGEAGEIDPASEYFHRTGSQLNVGDICRVMVFLILQYDVSYHSEDRINLIIDGRTFETIGGQLYELHDDLVSDGLDVDLLNLLYRGMSMDNNVQLGLIELARIVHERVTNRGDNGVERETDEAIRQRIFTLIHDADT